VLLLLLLLLLTPDGIVVAVVAWCVRCWVLALCRAL
jgi:hypothetical protein